MIYNIDCLSSDTEFMYMFTKHDYFFNDDDFTIFQLHAINILFF